jgi:micrococcal nuclease
MNKLTRYILLLVSILCLINPSACSKTPDVHLVQRVVDGDTILLYNNQRVRYIGIDAPETVHPEKPVQYFGREASAANKKLVEGKYIKLEYDIETTDKYGRTLAYVYLEDGTMVNLWLVENGYARAISYPPNLKYQEFFTDAESRARYKKIGLWKK